MSKRPLKVLSVCTSLGGGAGRAAYRIHQGVRSLGVDSRMLLKNGRSHDPSILTLDEFVPNNPFYTAFDWTRNKCKNKIQHFRWNRYPDRDHVFMSDLRGTDLHGALHKLDYDVLHLHWINQRFVHVKDLPKDKPIVWTLHDSWPFCGICHYFFGCEHYKQQCGSCPFLHSNDAKDLSHQIWKKKADVFKDLDLHIVSPSQWLAACAKQSTLLGRFPVTVIPNCLDVEAFRPLNEEEISPRWLGLQEIGKKKPLLLFGAVNAAQDKIKGFSYLISALKHLEQQGHKDDFELVVFGAKESELSMDVGIPIHYVGYVGNTSELVSLYNLASVMVVPSLTENLSCAIMESLSCGTPVVAFNIGGNGDMIEHKTNGYLAKEKEDADLARGILWCLHNNQDNRLGVAGREKVLRKYTFETVCGKYKEMYEGVVK
ncbi:MAG: glycosyltransferase family 4 protein [Bacteroidales bacterium]|nr:glycosyltransferase family 4 protein [Bacteroidales bacterium]